MKKDNNLSIPIYKDSRGEIRRYKVDGMNFNVLLTKAGVFRSGDYHPVRQYDLILKGEFEITLRQKDKDIVVRKGPNELIIIPPNVPHLFKSLTDTVMLEWWGGLFKAKYYRPYRELVEHSFQN